MTSKNCTSSETKIGGNISEILRLLRISKDWTAAELADKLDVSSAYVSSLEHGSRVPSEKILDKYCNIFGVTRETLDYFCRSTTRPNATYQKLLLKILKYLT